MRTVNPATEAEVLAQAEKAIRPKLALLEARRRGHILLTKLVTLGVFSFLAFFAFLAWTIAGSTVALVVLGGAAACAGVAFLAARRAYKGSARGEIVPPLAEAMGMTYSREAPLFDARRLVSIGVLPACEAVTAENLLQGRHRDTGFRVAEVRCWVTRSRGRQARGRRMTIWQGLVVEVQVPVDFTGPVVLARDRGTILNSVQSAAGNFGPLQRVAVPDPAFEKVFEVFAADPAEAERLLPQGLRESLVALSEARPGKALGAAFLQGLFFLAVPLKTGFLAQGRLFQPAETLLQELPQALRELSLPHRVIDYLSGDRPGPLL